MLKNGLILTLAIILMAAVPASSSKPLHPHPPIKTGYHEHTSQTSQTYQRGTDESPIVIKLANAEQSKEDVSQDAKQRKEESDNNWWITKFTGALVIVGFVQFFAMCVQAYWMRRTVADSTAQHIITNRAFVSVKLVNITAVITGDNQVLAWQFVPVIHNSGNTPTKHLLTHVSSMTSETELAADFDFPDIWADKKIRTIERFFIGPNAEVLSEVNEFSVTDMILAAQGLKHIYIWGWVDYNDIFKDTPRRRTEFAMKISVVASPRNPESRMQVSHHDRFNGADDECVRPPAPYIRNGGEV